MTKELQFSVGYQLPDCCRIADVVAEYRESIAEVYFPWAGVPTGRGVSLSYSDECAAMQEELAEIAGLGVRLDLLLNATCYGRQTVSCAFARKAEGIVQHLLDTVGLQVVTTGSLFLAQVLRERFPELQIRASVNMGVGTVSGMQALSPYFDSFYLKRELNRYPERIRPLSAFCREHGKGLYLLANSGCLAECPAHIFHDNLVSHEHELTDAAAGWDGFPGACWSLLAQKENRAALLFDTTWIRPEEIDQYASLVDGIKLATRSQQDPLRVIDRYSRRSFDGNMLCLCEPDFSGIACLENDRFPRDWMREIEAATESRKAELYERWFSHAYV